MARRGFLGRVRAALHAVFPVIPRESRRARKQAEPPPEPPKRKRAPTAPDDFQRAWTEETLRRPGTQEYRTQRDFFNSLYNIRSQSHADQVRLWREFIKFNQRGGIQRKDPRHPFWHASGIHPENFDWSGWRAIRDKYGTPRG